MHGAVTTLTIHISAEKKTELMPVHLSKDPLPSIFTGFTSLVLTLLQASSYFLLVSLCAICGFWASFECIQINLHYSFHTHYTQYILHFVRIFRTQKFDWNSKMAPIDRIGLDWSFNGDSWSLKFLLRKCLFKVLKIPAWNQNISSFEMRKDSTILMPLNNRTIFHQINTSCNILWRW